MYLYKLTQTSYYVRKESGLQEIRQIEGNSLEYSSHHLLGDCNGSEIEAKKKINGIYFLLFH